MVNKHHNIPRGWRLSKLRDVIKDIGDGGTPSRKNPENFGGDIPWAVVDDVRLRITSTRGSLTKFGLERSSAKLWPPRTVILTTGASIGRVGLADFSLATKQGITGIVCDEKQILPEYLVRYFESKEKYLNRIAQGSTFKEVRAPILQRLELFLPPIVEQRKITLILSYIDSVIDKTQAIIDQTQTLKKGLMQELFARGIPGRHKKFKKMEIGDMPEAWRMASISDIANVRYGLGQPPEIDDNGVPMVRATDIKNGKIISDLLVKVKKTAIPDSKNAYLQKDDLLLVRSGAYTGDVGYVDRLCDGYIAGYDLIIHPGKLVHSKYLFYYLVSPTIQNGYFRVNKSRSAQPHLNAIEIKKAKIPLPLRDEQKAIADFFDFISDAIELNDSLSKQYQQVKSALMQVLLSGEVRVKV